MQITQCPEYSGMIFFMLLGNPLREEIIDDPLHGLFSVHSDEVDPRIVPIPFEIFADIRGAAQESLQLEDTDSETLDPESSSG